MAHGTNLSDVALLSRCTFHTANVWTTVAEHYRRAICAPAPYWGLSGREISAQWMYRQVEAETGLWVAQTEHSDL